MSSAAGDAKSASGSRALILRRSEIEPLLTLDEYIGVVEAAFRSHAEGRTLGIGLVHAAASDGEFHVKAGGMDGDLGHFGLKANSVFFGNPARFGKPVIQGIIYLADTVTGTPLAIMESGFITVQRTAAATAVAAKYLAREDARVVTIYGCGKQALAQLRALASVRRLERVFAYSRDPERARRFALEASAALGTAVAHTNDVRSATLVSDIVVTCTPSSQPILAREDVRRGTFVAAVGADSPDKQELDPDLFTGTKVVVDLLDQCARVGDLHHALAAGTITPAEVHAELGQVIAGQRPGRTSAPEVTVFDSTGTALQDIAAAAAIYRRALATGAGLLVDLAT